MDFLDMLCYKLQFFYDFLPVVRFWHLFVTVL